MQMSMYNRKHWHALSHSLHFVRHEGRLATNGRTRLLAPWRPTSPVFLYTRCGTSSSSYSGMYSGWPARWSLVLVHLLVFMITAGPKPTLQLLRFCLSLISVTLSGRFSFLKVYGVVEVLIHEVSFALCSPPVTVKVLFVPVNSIVGGSIACLCSNSVGRSNPKVFNL